jgi:hypothetical protein
MQAHEVNVGRQVADHIALNATANDVNVRMAGNLQVEKGLQEATGLQVLQKIVIRYVDGDRL